MISQLKCINEDLWTQMCTHMSNCTCNTSPKIAAKIKNTNTNINTNIGTQRQSWRCYVNTTDVFSMGSFNLLKVPLAKLYHLTAIDTLHLLAENRGKCSTEASIL